MDHERVGSPCSAFGRDSGLLCFHATEVCGQQHRSRSNGVCTSSGGFPRLDRHRHMVQGNGHEAVVAVEYGNSRGITIGEKGGIRFAITPALQYTVLPFSNSSSSVASSVS